MNQPDPDIDAPFVPDKGLTAEGLWWLMLLLAVAVVGAAVVLVMFGRRGGIESANLREAAWMHPGDIVPLIEGGADPNELDPATGETALCRAVSYQVYESVKLLLEHGADPNLIDSSGVAPIVMPTLRYDDPQGLAIVGLLLDHKADITVQDLMHQSPLHRAAEAGNLLLVERLIAEGAEIDAMSDHGTPWHIAQRNGHGPVADALIRAGADTSIPDPGGPTGMMGLPSVGPVPAVPVLPAPVAP
jgi:hypothetical protein